MVIIRKKDGTNETYDEIGELHYGRAWVKKGEKYGYVNQNGDKVIDLMYDKAYNFEKDLALVIKDGKYGFINSEGKEIVPIEKDIKYLREDNIIGSYMGFDYVFEKPDKEFLNLFLHCNRGTT